MKSKYGFETSEQRSVLMGKIKHQNTLPEKLLRKQLWHLGFRYRLNVSKLPGKPDIVIEKWKLVIFIDGEFWHGYNWENKKQRIQSNRAYWIKKIERNIKRDLENTHKLESMGYVVIRFWEQEIKKEIGSCVRRVLNALEHHQYF